MSYLYAFLHNIYLRKPNVSVTLWRITVHRQVHLKRYLSSPLIIASLHQAVKECKLILFDPPSPHPSKKREGSVKSPDNLAWLRRTKEDTIRREDIFVLRHRWWQLFRNVNCWQAGQVSPVVVAVVKQMHRCIGTNPKQTPRRAPRWNWR